MLVQQIYAVFVKQIYVCLNKNTMSKETAITILSRKMSALQFIKVVHERQCITQY